MPDSLAFYALLADHWRSLCPTNPLERFNREIGRRTDVVGIFPTIAACSGWPGCFASKPTTNGLSGAAISAESISLVMAGSDDHTDRIEGEVRELQAA